MARVVEIRLYEAVQPGEKNRDHRGASVSLASARCGLTKR